ncbi:MAG TPA: hypothetical protein ENJ50_01745, partial [Planctomycetaceae bacterium]|nr:hypothetical protein [Planctomycetaceae bacterium]
MAHTLDERPVEQRLQVRPYDIATSWLVALLILLGSADAIGLLLWIRPLWRGPVAAEMQPIRIERVESQGHLAGGAIQKAVPGAEELEEFMEPDFLELLEQVTDIVTTIPSRYDEISSRTGEPAYG